MVLLLLASGDKGRASSAGRRKLHLFLATWNESCSSSWPSGTKATLPLQEGASHATYAGRLKLQLFLPGHRERGLLFLLAFRDKSRASSAGRRKLHFFLTSEDESCSFS